MLQLYKNHFALYMALFISTLLTSSFANCSVPGKKMAAKGNYLFVQSAKKASIKANNSKEKTYTIVLENTDPLITYFADRPIRNAGEMPLYEFMELWYHKNVNSFEKNPPNAVLHVKQTKIFTNDQVYDYALELSAPHYDKKLRKLTFTAKVLPGNVDKIPDNAVFDHVTLFIDSVCISCWGK